MSEKRSPGGGQAGEAGTERIDTKATPSATPEPRQPAAGPGDDQLVPRAPGEHRAEDEHRCRRQDADGIDDPALNNGWQPISTAAASIGIATGRIVRSATSASHARNRSGPASPFACGSGRPGPAAAP